MINSLKSAYEIKIFKSSRDKDFAKALRIYNRSIPANIRTDTNEITFWLDNYNKNIEGNTLFLLGLYLDEVLIGFAELVHIKRTKIIIIDYLVIDKMYRKNGAFYAFVNCLERFIDNQSLQYDYVLTEIVHMNNTDEPIDSSKLLIRLLKMEGFDIIKAPYRQPALGSHNYESPMNGQLMIWTNSNPHSLTKETYMAFIHSLYYDHYLIWYEKFLTETELNKYKNNLDSLYKDIDKRIRNNTVQVNGYHSEIDSKGAPPPVITGTNDQFKAVWGLATLILLITLVLIGVVKIFEISLAVIIPIYFISLLTIFAILSLSSKNAMKIFVKIGDLLKFVLRNIK